MSGIDTDTGLRLLNDWRRGMAGEEERVERLRDREKEAAKRAAEAAPEIEELQAKRSELRSLTGGLQASLSNLRRTLEELQPRLVAGDEEADGAAEEAEKKIRAATRRLEAVQSEAAATAARIGALEERGELAEAAVRSRIQAEAYVEGLRRDRWAREYRSYLRGAFEDRLQPDELQRRERLAAGKVAQGHGKEAMDWLQDHGMEAVRREHRGAAEPSSANRRPGIKEAVAHNAE